MSTICSVVLSVRQCFFLIWPIKDDHVCFFGNFKIGAEHSRTCIKLPGEESVVSGGDGLNRVDDDEIGLCILCSI